MLYQVNLNRHRRGETLVNVTVLYYLPDFRSILNEFIWQTIDRRPTYPRIEQFIDYWKEQIEAEIKEVHICDARGFDATRFRHVDYMAEIR